MSCYCEERRNNPNIAALMQELPEGFCGRCEICGRPGHTRAHPSLPVTSAWCDEHWAEITAPRRFTPDRLIVAAVVGIALLTAGTAVFRLFF